MPKTVVVTIQNFAFEPSSVTIDAGDSVSWENRDAMAHTATRNDPPAFDTGGLAQGEASEPIVFEYESDAKGWRYFCRPHPHMIGTVIVRAAAYSASAK